MDDLNNHFCCWRPSPSHTYSPNASLTASAILLASKLSSKRFHIRTKHLRYFWSSSFRAKHSRKDFHRTPISCPPSVSSDVGCESCGLLP